MSALVGLWIYIWWQVRCRSLRHPTFSWKWFCIGENMAGWGTLALFVTPPLDVCLLVRFALL